MRRSKGLRLLMLLRVAQLALFWCCCTPGRLASSPSVIAWSSESALVATSTFETFPSVPAAKWAALRGQSQAFGLLLSRHLTGGLSDIAHALTD